MTSTSQTSIGSLCAASGLSSRGWNVRRQGRWYVLEGHVETHSIKAKIIRSVPKHGGVQWVIDRLIVGEPIHGPLT